MTKKQTKEHNYYFKICGARFGDDGAELLRSVRSKMEQKIGTVITVK